MRRTLILGLVFCAGLVAARKVEATPQTVKRPPENKAGGTLTGVAIGPDDKPVPNAVITYQSAGGNAPHVVRADEKGRFTITKLRSDSYELRAAGKGVFSEWEKNVFVRAGETKFLRLSLIYAKEVPRDYTATQTYQ
jgi:hypothetical protein